MNQRTFKDFKEEESCDEEVKEYQEMHKEVKYKKKSNLSKFKNIINKMKDMPIEEYMNYIENYYGSIDKNQNVTYCIEDQLRVNKFLDSMRKNIEKFKGRQSILKVNCQPIDYIITVGNGLCDNINEINNNSNNNISLKNEFSKENLSD